LRGGKYRIQLKIRGIEVKNNYRKETGNEETVESGDKKYLIIVE